MPSRTSSSRSASVASSSSLASSAISDEAPVYPILDEQFLPRIVAIFYSIFHPIEGAKVVYQVPEEVISTFVNAEKDEEDEIANSTSVAGSEGNVEDLNRKTPIFDFKSISEFIIPKAPLCGRLISYSIASSSGHTYKILSHPVILLDQVKYPRKSFIFNLAFVFDGRADTRAYEPIVRKCARELKDLEISSSFLSKSQSRMYVVIEQLFEDLNSYCESFVALPNAPHSQFEKEIGQGPFSFIKQSIGTDEARSDIGSPFSNSGFQIPEGSSKTDKTWANLSAAGESLRKALEQVEAATPATITERSASIESLTTRPPARRASTENQGGSSSTKQEDEALLISNRKNSAGSLIGPRPGVGRSKTVAALALSETTVNAIKSADPSRIEPESKGLERNGSVGSSSSTPLQDHDFITDKPENGLHESITSLRRVGASGEAMERTGSGLRDSHKVNESVGAVPPAPMLGPGKREPPHGLGRTVRDAINLKLFPTYPNPAEINDWDVPVTLLDLRKRMTGNWDLTMCRVLPFIDGVNHVKRIAQLADADLELTRQCIEHLLYYRCIITTDIFQFTNMYTVRPSIAIMAEDETIMSECASYVTKPNYKALSWPKLLSLYSTLRSAITINDWIETNNSDELGIDVRRFVSFGVIKGFLRRVHRFPILVEEVPTNRDDSNSRSRERVAAIRQADSSPHQLSPQTPTLIDTGSPIRGRNSRLRYPSENESLCEGGAATTSITSMPTRRRYGETSQSHRKSRATVVDAANVALEAAAVAKEQDRQSMLHPSTSSQRVSIRTPITRGGSNTTIRGIQSKSAGQKESEDLAASRRPSKSSIQIPPEMISMLHGTHPDDEFCVKFGLSWDEILNLLFIIGKQSNVQTLSRTNISGSSNTRRKSKVGEQDEDTLGEADKSGVAGWSGLYGTTIGGHRKSIGSSLPRYRNQSHQNSCGIQSSGFSRYASTGESVSGWGRMSGLQSITNSNTIPEEVSQINRESLARGDLGKVKIIVK